MFGARVRLASDLKRHCAFQDPRRPTEWEALSLLKYTTRWHSVHAETLKKTRTHARISSCPPTWVLRGLASDVGMRFGATDLRGWRVSGVWGYRIMRARTAWSECRSETASEPHTENPATAERSRPTGRATRARSERVATDSGHGPRRLQPDPRRTGVGQDPRDHLPGRLPDRSGSAARVDLAGHVHPPGRPGDGRPARDPDRARRHPGLGRDVSPHRQSPPPARGAASGLRGELHDPRQRRSARPDPERHGGRRAVRDRQARTESRPGAASDQLCNQYRPAPRRARQGSSSRTSCPGSPNCNKRPSSTPSASAPPTAWTTTTCSFSGRG